jgi:two-component system, NarL family, sensor histidine kinase UhpB
MKALRILMLEDNSLDVSIILKTLSNSSIPFECVVVDSGRDYISKLDQEEFDIILCDYQLPDFDATKALQVRNQKKSSIPFILISGAVSEEVAINIIKEGANDYILKDRLQRLPIAIEKAINKEQLRFDKQSIEASLSQLTERFQLAAKTSFDVIWDFDIEKNLVYCSDAIEKIIGITLQQNFEPQFLAQFIHPDDLPAIEKSFFLIIKGKEHRWRKIFRVVRTDGTIGWVNSNAMVMRNKKDKATRMVGVMHDVTEVRRLQHELVEQEMQIQKQVTKITIQAQEKERMEIGRELHDNVNQLLATAKIMIDTARNIPDLHDICLEKSQETIMDAINELRNLAHSMMPPPFDNNDFPNIVMDLVDKLNLTGRLNVELSLPPVEIAESIHNDVKLCMYRIIQEQISNVLKYAHAKNVSIGIEAIDSQLCLLIQDDGNGFDPLKLTKGIGLKNIENRCGLFGGNMQLITAPGKGCVLKIQIPVKNTFYA